jgi:uncharacterized protein (DUF2267 family)
MKIDFEKYAKKGNEFMNILARKLGDENKRDRAGRILRSVFAMLRNHISVEESIQLLAQLPVAIKGIYVDGWTLSHSKERIRTFDGLVNEIATTEGPVIWRDFSNRNEIIEAIRAVVETMAHYVSAEEMMDAFGTLPKGLKESFQSWISNHQLQKGATDPNQ